MALVVQKFGGTSDGSIKRMQNVARRVAKVHDNGNQMVVILSAMSGVTDRLIEMAQEASPEPDKRELDALLATGEQTTVALLAMLLRNMGYKATSLLGHQADILTNDQFCSARIISIGASRIRELLQEGHIVVVAGFQGCDAKGNITTLGRGGSDTSAVAIAAAINADVCEIFTDVDGIYTADPNVCDKARKMAKISYEEMLELSSLGAKVLQIRSVEFAKKYNVPVHVRSSFNEEEGTMVVQEDADMERLVVSGITCSKNESRITLKRVPDQPGIAAKIFSPLAKANIIVDMIIQNYRTGDDMGRETDVSFTVPKGDFKTAFEISRKVAEDINAGEVTSAENIAKVSVVGVGMKNHSGVASKMFEALSGENINIRMISTSEIRISCVIEQKYAELAVRVLHSAFDLDKS